MISFKHSGNAGDVIWSLPTMIYFNNRFQEKLALYLNVGKLASYYPGCVHPLKNVLLNQDFADKLIPLLQSQPWFDKVEIYDGQPVDMDLDLFRETGMDLTRGCLARYYFYAFLANYDLSKPWLYEPNLWRELGAVPEKHNKILVNRTLRYRNPNISYRFLSRYADIVFVGLQDEYESFKKEVPNAEWVCCNDFLELARLIAGCKLFIGNQSLAFGIAEALKVPRALEICLFAPNVIVHGLNGFDFVGQGAFETIVHGMVTNG